MFLPIVKPMVRTVLRILSILLFALTIVSAYGGYADTLYVGFLGVLVMIMPYLAALTMLVTLLWFLTGRWITGCLGIVTLLASWAPLSEAFPFKTERNPSPGAQQFTLLTWNFLHGWDQNYDSAWDRGYRSTTQPDNKALQFILDTDADIVCLQESTQWEEPEPPHLDKYLTQWNKQYPYTASEGNKDTRVFSKYPVHLIPMSKILDSVTHGIPDYISDRQLLHFMSFYQVDVPGHPLVLVNVHLYSPSLTDKERNVMTDMKSVDSAKASAREFKNSIYSKLKKSLRMHREQVRFICDVLKGYEGSTIVCGDFNDVPESYAWRMLVKDGFKDAYAQVGFGPMITYNKHLFLFHIDQIMYRGPLYPLSVKKGKIKTSDHYPLVATFEFEQHAGGK